MAVIPAAETLTSWYCIPNVVVLPNAVPKVVPLENTLVNPEELVGTDVAYFKYIVASWSAAVPKFLEYIDMVALDTVPDKPDKSNPK